MIYNNILETIGDTPVVRLESLGTRSRRRCTSRSRRSTRLASVKDRLAYAIINDAEQKGHVEAGSDRSSRRHRVIPASRSRWSVRPRATPFVATMADSFSVERRQIMRGLGAKVILTPAAERGSGMVRKAEELAEKHGWFLARQFENPANPEYHANTTGPEILRDFAGQRLDYWVTGYGTGGTMTGAGKTIKAARPEVQIVATEPAGAALLAGSEWAPHKIQGWTPDFIPGVLDREIFDHLKTVTDDRAIAVSRELAAKEGIFTGISAARRSRPRSTLPKKRQTAP